MAEQTQTELKYDIYQPFGPSVLKVKLPQNYVNLLNVEEEGLLMITIMLPLLQVQVQLIN